MPTVHQKHALSASWAGLTDTVDRPGYLYFRGDGFAPRTALVARAVRFGGASLVAGALAGLLAVVFAFGLGAAFLRGAFAERDATALLVITSAIRTFASRVHTRDRSIRDLQQNIRHVVHRKAQRIRREPMNR
jgi:hypothetical protein